MAESVELVGQKRSVRIEPGDVFLAHGEDDTRVLYKQSVLYAAALKKAGKSYEFYSYKDEGHGFSSSEHLQDWLNRLEAFLAKYNPAD